jgi:hypothetical protein
MGVNEEQRREFFCRRRILSSLFPVAASAEQEARLPPHHGSLRVCDTQPSSLRTGEEEKDVPKTPLGSWARSRNRPEPTGIELSWNNSSLVEAICLSTRNMPPLPHPELIRSPLPLTIRCWYRCLATLKPNLIRAGRSRPRHGQPCESRVEQGEPLRHIARGDARVV